MLFDTSTVTKRIMPTNIDVQVFMGYSIGHKPSSVPVLEEQVLALLLKDFDENKYKSGYLMSCIHGLTQAVQEVHDKFVHTNMFIRAETLNITPGKFDKSVADQVSQFCHQFIHNLQTWSFLRRSDHHLRSCYKDQILSEGLSTSQAHGGRTKSSFLR